MYHYYRHPRTTNERRQNQPDDENREWYRAKRSYKNIIDAWNDVPVSASKEKCWKRHRKTKYHIGKRGQRHEVKVYEWKDVWKLKDYCEQHGISYTTERVQKKYTKTYRCNSRWGKLGYSVPRYHRNYKWVNGVRICTSMRLCGYEPVYGNIPCEPYIRTYTYSELLYYKFVWWHNKDICVERILNGNNQKRNNT